MNWKNGLSRFGLSLALGLLLGLLALEPAWGDSTVITLDYWHIFGGELGRLHEGLIEEFNATHPGIQVRYSYSGDPWTGWDKLLLAIAAGTGPDLALIEDYWTAKLASSGALIGLDRLIEEERAFKEDVYPLFWQSLSYRDQIWAVPYAMSNLVLFYNKDLFRQAGLDPERPPRTWEELVKLGRALTKDLDGDGRPDQWGLSFPLTAQGGVVYYWLPFLWQNGGELFNEDYTEPRFAGPEGVGALQFWLELIYEHGILPLSPPLEGFLNGRVAMTLGSSAKLGTYKARARFELGVAPLSMNKARATILGGKGLAILARAWDEGKQRAAWEFITWLVAPEQNLRWSMATGYIPIRLSTLSSLEFQAYLREEPEAEVALEELIYTRPRPVFPAYTEASRLIGLALEQAIFGREDPQAVLKEAAEEVQRYL
ncbi:MAG: ABC transporter substrate-binding protein [Candidatus Bipolaricaulia bacterium]